METSIIKDGKETPVAIKEPTGEHQEKYYELLASISGEEPMKTIDFLRYKDALILELTENVFKNPEELKKLPLVEKNKILRLIESRFAIVAEDEKKLLKN